MRSLTLVLAIGVLGIAAPASAPEAGSLFVIAATSRTGEPHSEIYAIYSGGYSKWTIRPGVALRVDF